MLIISVKQKVMDLVKFFDGISQTIETMVDNSVDEFLRVLAESVSDDDTDAKLGNLRVGNYTLTDLQRTVSSYSVWYLIYQLIAFS